MKRMLFHTLLTAGLFLLASGNAFAQRHEGGGGHEGGTPRGPTNAVGPVGPAHVEQGPTVRSDVRTTQPDKHNYGANNHPFYGNEQGHDNEWRYGFHDNRWWYWTAANAWAYWNDGRWQDYSDSNAVPYTTNYRGPAAPVGWYWNDSQKRYYWFDGSNLTAAAQQ